ncbi:conjugative transposon protein TraM [uncultured Algoriphagus sp.]|uniref:conjugative transposon protein TraM n=1 Tax=uncultured Algoriphagus sp. TaxID=417365 RepID=UPI0030EE1224|tara:strand:+ start:3229 stop:4461 length:1233 start_codon:yes stop_codon:yes gene_type:complete
MKQLTEKQKKDRKFLLVLPVLTLPFLCLAFWALGGGKHVEEFETASEKGLNMGLPEAYIEVGSMDKMKSYEEAERKASQLREQLRMDPFANRLTQDTVPAKPGNLQESSRLSKTEDALQEKLADLQNLVSNPPVKKDPYSSPQLSSPIDKGQDSDLVDQDLKRLESMMAAVVEPGMEDPEMQRIDNLLDKLLDVQHPQRVEQRLSEARKLELQAAFAVSPEPNGAALQEEVGMGIVPTERNGFYTLENETRKSFSSIHPAISAQVTRDQEVVSGASIEMELTQPVFIEGIEFPKGTRVTGVCALRGDRLNINVQALRSGNLIIPVSLEATDLDALPGIKIPDAITRDAIKEGAGDGVESLGMMGMSSSWEAQASMAGMETVKGILSKKAKLVRVTVKAGHPLLLTDMSNK